MARRSTAAAANVVQRETEPTDIVAKDPGDDRVDAIERAIGEHRLLPTETVGVMRQAIRIGTGIKLLRALLTDEFMAEHVMPLQGSAMGFRTDRDREGGYAVAEVREAVIEALLRGVRCTGNEFNIISRRAYVTREGAARLLCEFPGMTDLTISARVRSINDRGSCIVDWSATWKLDGATQSMPQQELPLRVHPDPKTGMVSLEAALGKADRKIRWALLRHLTGSHSSLIPEGEVEEQALPGAASAPTLLAPGRHDLRKPPARPEPEPTPAPWQPSEADRREIAGYISGADDATWAAFVAQCERIGADQDDMESWTEAQFAALLGYVRDQKAAAE